MVSPKGAEAGSKAVEAQLERLNKSAERTGKVIERIGRRVRVGGIKRAQQAVSKVGDEAKNTGKILRRIFAGIGVALVTRKLIELSDTFTNYQNRLKLVTTGTENLTDVTERLFKISDNTRSSFGATAELFARVALASKDLGRSQEELLRFTESLNKAVILSGASAQEASAGIIQLSQGLASGALRGDELRSVLEQLPKVADVIAESLGITRGELRALGEEGKLSAGIIFDAFKKAEKGIAEDFAKTVPTIGQAFTQLTNQLIKLIGAFNNVTGASTLFAQTIQLVGSNLKILIQVLALTAIGWAAMAIQEKIAAGATVAAGLASIRATIALHPFAAAFVAIGAATAVATSAIADYFDEVSKLEEQELAKSPLEKATDRYIRLKNEIAQLEKVIRSSATGVRDHSAALKQLNLRLAISADQIAKARGETRSYVAENLKLANSLEETISGLREETNILATNSRERKVAIRLQKEIRKLEKSSGAKVTDAQREELEALIKFNRFVKERQKVLEDIKGPEQERARTTALINDLALEGIISTQEQTEALKELSKVDPPKFDLDLDKFAIGASSLTDLLAKIREESERVGESGAVLGERFAQALGRAAGEAGTLREKIERITAASDKAGVSQEVLKQAIDELAGVPYAEQMRIDLDDLNLKLERGIINQIQFNDAVRDLGPIGEKSATTLSAGFEKAFARIRDEANDLAAVGEKLVDTFANAAVDAITTFAETGKFSFKDFTRSLLADIAKIITRLLIVKALSAVAGGAGLAVSTAASAATTAVTSTNQGRQDGGTVQPGRSFVVGENGPEIFTPGQTGTITANIKDQPQAAPEVNVNVVNVTDPDEVASAIDSQDVDQNIVNLISRNKDSVNAVLN